MTALGSGRGGGPKATSRDDWLDAALALLARRGVAAVSVLDLSDRLGVSRSSFYWHFRSRDALFEALLDRWEALNTRAVVEQAEAPAATIAAAVGNVMRLWVDAALFSPRLDVSVRAWARLSDDVRVRLDAADRARIAAIEAMFVRHGFAAGDAAARARALYTMQVGHHALAMAEPPEALADRAALWIEAFTGAKPGDEEVAAFRAYALAQAGAPDFDDPA